MAIFVSTIRLIGMESGTRKGRALYKSVAVPCLFLFMGGLRDEERR